MTRTTEDERAEHAMLRAIAAETNDTESCPGGDHDSRAANRAILREALAVALDRSDQAAIARLTEALERAG